MLCVFVNLLCILNNRNDDEQGNYCAITRLSGLHCGKVRHRHGGSYYTWERCCRDFRLKEAFETQGEWYQQGKALIEEIPSEELYDCKRLGYYLRL